MVGSDQRGPLHSHGVARRLNKPFEPPAPVAQRIEHLTTDQKVGSSNLPGCASIFPSQQPQRRSIGLPDSPMNPIDSNADSNAVQFG